jgi:hypothetical protein
MWPVVLSGLLGFVGGKSGGSGMSANVEVGTKKETTQNTYTNTNTYAPVTTKTYDIQYNIADNGSNITTKKEQSLQQTPNISPIVAVTPISAQGGDAGMPSGTGAGMNVYDIAILIALGGTGYFLVKKYA